MFLIVCASIEANTLPISQKNGQLCPPKKILSLIAYDDFFIIIKL